MKHIYLAKLRERCVTYYYMYAEEKSGVLLYGGLIFIAFVCNLQANRGFSDSRLCLPHTHAPTEASPWTTVKGILQEEWAGGASKRCPLFRILAIPTGLHYPFYSALAFLFSDDGT
ncbi:hypothetical protein Nepgr_000674 [Nepenthes gracilis]|uniref:Uncharacterized protein n=1 Tax=Nepenthes gracilis TaxID=150966 RepID=A0AAD3RX05_NEPGR|nr:hypothetical protein Nepgr_000674 [Nepenthes gracilis]